MISTQFHPLSPSPNYSRLLTKLLPFFVSLLLINNSQSQTTRTRETENHTRFINKHFLSLWLKINDLIFSWQIAQDNIRSSEELAGLVCKDNEKVIITVINNNIIFLLVRTVKQQQQQYYYHQNIVSSTTTCLGFCSIQFRTKQVVCLLLSAVDEYWPLL